MQTGEDSGKPFRLFGVHERRHELIIATSFALAFVLVIFFTDLITIYPYEIEIAKVESQSQEYSRYYDITGNGTVEKITFCTYGELISIEVFDAEQSFLGATRLRGGWPTSGDYHVFGDSDNDKVSEIYCLTEQNDSLYLNVVRGIEQNAPDVVSMFLTCTSSETGRRDYHYTGLMVDVDGDLYNELFFFIHGGFSLIPRQLFIYYPSQHRIVASEDIGASMTLAALFDLDGDGTMEVFMGSGSTQNYGPDDPVVFGDQKAGAFIYDKELNMIAEPFVVAEGKPYIYHFPIITGEEWLRAVHVYDQTGRVRNRLLILDQDNHIIREQSFDGNNFMVAPVSAPGGDMHYYFCSLNDPVLMYDPQTNRMIRTGVDGTILVPTHRLIRPINQPVIMVFENTLSFRDHTLAKVSNEIHTGPLKRRFDRGTVQSDGHFEYVLYKPDNTAAIFVHMHNNPLYEIRWVIFTLVVLLSWLLFFSSAWLVRFLYLRRRLFEYRVRALQLQSIHNQLQPHFTFNVLNTVGSMIYSEDKDRAYEYLSNVSELLRAVLDNSGQHFWTLDHELQFINAYVQLENVRFSGRFDFQLHIDPSVDRKIYIPKMMIQTFVENALRHGLSHKKKDCRLMLHVENDSKHIRVSVEDNGIGRERSQNIIRHRPGKGMKFIEELLQSYNRMVAVPLRLEILDLESDRGEPSGTRVVLFIPKEMRRFDD
jgi:hypothetical protein